MDRVRYLVGLLTLAAALAGAWYLWGLLRDPQDAQRHTVRVEFRNARGLKTGADVRYRGVVIGTVRDLRLRADARRAEALLAILPGQEALVCANTQFWIVTPRFVSLTAGATGLDTLVRDAYVACITPEPRGPELPPGSTLGGLEGPSGDESEGVVEPVRHGDLLLVVLAPENHGVTPGIPVRYRGVRTGEVRQVRLAPDGGWVEFEIRIGREWRTTVTTESLFWIARPKVSVELSGISMEDVGSLLSPFVGYWSPPGRGVPAPENWRTRAAVERPPIPDESVPARALGGERSLTDVAPSGVQLVRVVYDAIERDTLSADDRVHREGTGILWADPNGRLLVLCPRSVCDGNWFVRDTFGGDPDIEEEQHSITLKDGPVLRAGRMWTDPDGADLAILVLEDPPAGLATTPPGALGFDAAETPLADVDLLTVEPDGWKSRRWNAADPPPIERVRGAALGAPGLVTAILGQRAGDDETPAAIRLARVPVELRPRP
jgi:hypothetical protein